jgi:branched-chain amino acid transport system ATP-binding protein
MLEVSALRSGYGAVEVLRGIDLNIGAGEIVAVLGSNGAGKSTLNNTVCGLVPAFGGRVAFGGRDITRARHTDIVAAGLIQVPEGRRVFPNLSVRENLELGSYRRGREHRAWNMERVFSVFPRLEERTAQRAGTLSGGEQQMLAIGRALMAEPRLLILDEPSLGLSPMLVDEMFSLVKRLNAEGLSILLVEQNVGQALEIAHRAYVLENGAMTFHGTPADLLGKSELKRAYLGI